MAISNRFSKIIGVSNSVIKTVFLIAFICFMLVHLFDREVPRPEKASLREINKRSYVYNLTIERYYDRRKYWVTSNLGSILFKNQPIKYSQQNRTFTVLVWSHPWWTQENNSLFMCSVNNCVFTDKYELINKVDAVVVTTYQGRIPWVHVRKRSQRWVFLSSESPVNTFVRAERKFSLLAPMANVFNWSMTYRSDSDVPIPYGRTVPLTEAMMHKISTRPITKVIPYWDYKQKDVLAVAMISNCGVAERLNYINELQKYIKVDLFGRCATTTEMRYGCPPYADCPKLRNYLFFLAFENTGCRQYITEKVFHNAFAKGAIPVVMGAPLADYEKLLPPNSFLHVNSFNSPRELAMEIIHLSTNDDYLETYHKWRQYFEITNEHGNFGNKLHDLCRLCEALNYNDNQTKVYDEDTLKLFLDPKLLCTTPVNPPPHLLITDLK
ncbi:hypothetical protein ABMA28_015001 [Loxostege sticticalis]|uniref:Fucosyltransferase n=1 Tax=Loxostege sticticalis TaxID=481309 RepID=A0ABD0TDZ4_LOXSC